MNTSITLKALVFFVILIISGKTSYSQVRKGEIPANLTLPDSYYKGIEEKRKHAESQKPASINTTTATTFYPLKTEKKEVEENPEVMAKNMLNTSSVPADFPLYNSYSASEKEYEGRVAAWFKANPSYRKINK